MALTKEQLAGLHQAVAQRARCPVNVTDRLDAFCVGLATAVEIVGAVLTLSEPQAEPKAQPGPVDVPISAEDVTAVD